MALRDLSEGLRGEDVRALQNGLNEYFRGSRAALSPDGAFGSKTRAAVDALQRANPGTGKPDGTPDGIAGRRSRRALFPLAVVTVSAVGYRLKMPSLARRGIQAPRLGPGPLQPPGTPQQPGFQPNLSANVRAVDWSQVMRPAKLDFKPQHFPGLRLPIVAPPAIMVPRLRLDPLPSPQPAPTPSIGQIHHFELSSGGQINLANPSETSFTFAVQAVALRGDDDGPHQEIALGSQIGSPNADGSGDWSYTWYAQYTDVDRLGAIGQFHWWQPYAQLGVQNTFRTFKPVITGALFPVNLGFDVNKALTVSVAGGLTMTYDPATGNVQAGVQGTAGLILKFDQPRRSR